MFITQYNKNVYNLLIKCLFSSIKGDIYFYNGQCPKNVKRL